MYVTMYNYKESYDNIYCTCSLCWHNVTCVLQVGLAKTETLIQRLHSYLMGELDNEPKEARFLFGMYLSLGQYQEASQTAILIAKEDQHTGNILMVYV